MDRLRRQQQCQENQEAKQLNLVTHEMQIDLIRECASEYPLSYDPGRDHQLNQKTERTVVSYPVHSAYTEARRQARLEDNQLDQETLSLGGFRFGLAGWRTGNIFSPILVIADSI